MPATMVGLEARICRGPVDCTNSDGCEAAELVELTMTEQRYRAVLEVQAGVPVTEVAERFGVSRQAVHRWVGWYRDEGLDGLAGRSSRPRSSGRFRLLVGTGR
jgi:hypothetical protein